MVITSIRTILLTGLLKGKTGKLIFFNIDGSAAPETAFFQQSLHNRLIPMGINSQVSAHGIGPQKAERPNALHASVRLAAPSD